MELGNTPDAIHPSRKRAVMSGQHPLGTHPALSLEQQKKLATDSYLSTADNVRRYHGSVPNSHRGATHTMLSMMQALQGAMQIEHSNKAALERLAVNTVLRMPEFKSLRQPYMDGAIKIDAKLDEPDLSRAALSDEVGDDNYIPDYEVPEVKQEIDDAVMRRRFTNAMIQGAAVSNNYAFVTHAKEALDRIDPRLVGYYGKVMSGSEFGYWTQDDEIVKAAAKASGSAAQGGASELTEDPDGVPVIKARGLVFPILVQEIIKGLMEYLSHNDEEDADTRTAVQNKADLIDEETWSMLLGPALWRKFMAAAGADAQEIMPYLYDAINRMPNSEFNALMKGVNEETPQGKQALAKLAGEIRRDIGNQTESLGFASRITGD